MSYYIATLYNTTLKKDLQKKKVCSKRSAKQKKVVIVLDLNQRQYPQQFQGSAYSSVVLQRNTVKF